MARRHPASRGWRFVSCNQRNPDCSRSPAALAGLIEVRGLGIRRVAHEPMAVVGLVVDLSATDTERLPASEGSAVISGVRLPRLAVAARADPLALVLAFLGTAAFQSRGET